jgi:hypothetical protein
MNEKPATRKLEALLTLARSDFDSRRKSPWRWVISGAILLAGAALFFWWVGLPKSSPKPWMMVACDAVALPDESITLVGKVETEGEPGDMEGIKNAPVVFQETVSNQQQTSACDGQGIARFQASFPASPLPLAWFLRYPGTARRPPVQARGAIFVRPPQTVWLIVDADHALPAIPEQEFWARERLQAPLMPGALAALREVRKDREIAYVATSAETVRKHLLFKAWLARGWASPKEQPPDGPLFTRAESELSAPALLQAVAADLQKRFTSPVVALVARPEEAKAFIDVGVRTILLGDGDGAPRGAIVVKSWGDKLAEKIEGAGR